MPDNCWVANCCGSPPRNRPILAAVCNPRAPPMARIARFVVPGLPHHVTLPSVARELRTAQLRASTMRDRSWAGVTASMVTSTPLYGVVGRQPTLASVQALLPTALTIPGQWWDMDSSVPPLWALCYG